MVGKGRVHILGQSYCKIHKLFLTLECSRSALFPEPVFSVLWNMEALQTCMFGIKINSDLHGGFKPRSLNLLLFILFKKHLQIFGSKLLEIWPSFLSLAQLCMFVKLASFSGLGTWAQLSGMLLWSTNPFPGCSKAVSRQSIIIIIIIMKMPSLLINILIYISYTVPKIIWVSA